MPSIEQSLGQLARNIPGATEVFRKYHLSYCCGGKQRLGDVLRDQGIDPVAVIAELDRLKADGDSDGNWSEASPATLTEHIVERYHDRHRQQLPELAQLAAKVETVHAAHPECPTGLAQHIGYMWRELEQHMCKEEQVLFPMLTGACGIQSRAPLLVMRAEHDEHRQALERIISLTGNLQAPTGACNTWHALYVGLEQFCNDLKQHMHLENNILFADAEELLENYS